MNTDWKNFLIDTGAEYEPDTDNEIATFGNPEREKRYTLTGSILCDLSHLGLIEIQGEDAQTFLQGQATNDVTKINADTSHPGAFCNPKGRILASYRMFQRDDAYYLALPQEMVESTIQRLKMFVLMSKVTISDASSSLIRFGVSGVHVEAEIKDAVTAVPADIDQVVSSSGVSVIRIAGDHPRFIILADLEKAKNLWNKLNVQCAPVSASSWRLLNINAAYPVIYSATKEMFVPQMVNLELLNGVSFKKGCYTGQEIVARMHYLGKSKRRMYPIHFESDAVVAVGSALFSAEDKTEQSVGNIVESAASPDGGVDALAVLKIKFAAANSKVYLESLQGAEAVVESPPYALNLE